MHGSADDRFDGVAITVAGLEHGDGSILGQDVCELVRLGQVGGQ
ncbi:MAG: hypothetical protein ACR2KP_20800 [Egibacteraceae bacterium]